MATPQTEPRPAAHRTGWAHRFSLDTILTGLTVIASYWAVRGWLGVAHDWLGMTGPDAYLLFGLFEGTIIALVLVAIRTRLGGDAALILWFGVWGLTGLAVTVQVYHALGSDHPQSALIYGSASLVTVLLWQLKTRQANREALRELGLIADPTVRLGVGLWLRFPRWSWRAQTVARWEGLSRPAEALRRAQVLYPAGTMPWEKAHARAARKTARKTPAEDTPTGATDAAADDAFAAIIEDVYGDALKDTASPPSKDGQRKPANRRRSTSLAGRLSVVKDAPEDLTERAREIARQHRQENNGRLPGVRPYMKALRIGEAKARELRDLMDAELGGPSPKNTDDRGEVTG